MHIARPSSLWALDIALLFLLSLSSLVLPSTSSSTPTIGVASDAEQVVGVSSYGSPSLSTPGGQKLFEDDFGKFLAIYIDWAGRISVSYANSNPSSSGAWAASVKSAGSSAYSYPAGVLVNSTSLRILAENVTGSGPGLLGQIVDIPAIIQRDSGNNIIGLLLGIPKVLDASGFAQFPTATLAHNGDILAAWNWLNNSTRVETFRWNHNSGSWASFTGLSSYPDNAIVDGQSPGAIYPSIIERPDNFNVYVIGNYDNSGPSSLVFNKATFASSAWSWGTQNLSYETSMAHGVEDSASLAWDPLKSLVVVSCRMTGANSYSVFTLDASDIKIHLNTPTFSLSNANYGIIAVNATNGDYYLLLLNVASDGGTGSVVYTKTPSGSSSWNTSLTQVDSGTNNRALTIRRSGVDRTLDILYEDDGTVPVTIRIARVSSGSLPPALIVEFAQVPATPSPGQPATFTGTASGGLPPYTFSWNFGDGLAGSGANITHTYANLGMYSVRLNVTDSRGVKASHQHGIVATSATFSFASSGDWDFTPETSANWQSISTSGVNFTLALGDFLYSIPTTQQAQQSWCSNFKAKAPGGNVEILIGNHETFEDNATSGGGSISKYILYCPFTLASYSGTYGFQYYFDYPSVAPLARFIMVDPAIWLGNTTNTRVPYSNGSPAQQWVAVQIDDARAKGIPWIIVGMHKDCISAGVEGCEVGVQFTNFLISKRVDLVIQGHDHDYQRSKQLTCATPEVYISSCVINDGSSGAYQKGDGTVYLIDGTGGATLDRLNVTDGDSGYFATVNNSTWGYTKAYVSRSSLLAQFIPTTGTFNDSWSISTTDAPPLWLPGSSLRAAYIDARRLTLFWTQAVDATQVSGYKLYSNGTLLATLSGSATSYNANGLTPLTHYFFQIQAGNPSGHWTVNGPSTLALTRLTGDVNLDCRVNIIDLSSVGASFGARLGEAGYNSKADLNGDGAVNIIDLSQVGSNFGENC